MQHDGQGDDVQSWADCDPQTWAWLPGVDYAAGWREAKTAADALNAALLGADIWPGDLRAVADTDAEGAPRVRLIGTVTGTERLRALLDARGRTDAA